MYPIASYTVTSTAAETAFTSIPQNFTHLQLRMYGRSPSSTTSTAAGFTTSYDAPYIRFNGDATAANYADHMISGDGTTVAYNNSVGGTTAIRIGVMPGAATTANYFGFTVIDIFDYTNTNKAKTVRAISGADANTSGYAVFRSGLWLSTAAINQIYLGGYTGGYAIGSRFDLYGVVNS
jgi:hypothetical protein